MRERNTIGSIKLQTVRFCGPGWCSRYSHLLWAGQFRDRITVGARSSTPVQTGPGALTASYTMRTGSLSRRYSGRIVELTTHPHLVPGLKKEWSYTSTAPLGLHGLFQGELLTLTIRFHVMQSFLARKLSCTAGDACILIQLLACHQQQTQRTFDRYYLIEMFVAYSCCQKTRYYFSWQQPGNLVQN